MLYMLYIYIYTYTCVFVCVCARMRAYVCLDLCVGLWVCIKLCDIKTAFFDCLYFDSADGFLCVSVCGEPWPWRSMDLAIYLWRCRNLGFFYYSTFWSCTLIYVVYKWKTSPVKHLGILKGPCVVYNDSLTCRQKIYSNWQENCEKNGCVCICMAVHERVHACIRVCMHLKTHFLVIIHSLS